MRRSLIPALILAGTLHADTFTSRPLDLGGGYGLALNNRDQILALDNYGLSGFIQNPNGERIGINSDPGDGGTWLPNNFNDRGDVVGYVLTGEKIGIWLQPDGTLRGVMPDNTYRVSVSAINNSGVMVGTAQLVSSGPGNQSFIYDSAQNQYQFIKIPGSTGAVFAGDINNRGVIVGEYCPDEFCLGGGQSFIDDHGHIQLFNVPGATTTYLSAINDFGSFGGTYQDASGRYFGFVNIDGQITTISQSGYTQVLDINNLGEILVGDTVSNPTGEDTRNYSIWWNAAETPEPTTLALMGLGFMAAGLTAIRRRR